MTEDLLNQCNSLFEDIKRLKECQEVIVKNFDKLHSNKHWDEVMSQLPVWYLDRASRLLIDDLNKNIEKLQEQFNLLGN
jgi:hypothetical protein